MIPTVSFSSLLSTSTSFISCSVVVCSDDNDDDAANDDTDSKFSSSSAISFYHYSFLWSVSQSFGLDTSFLVKLPSILSSSTSFTALGSVL